MSFAVRHFTRAIVVREVAIWALARALVAFAGAEAAANLGIDAAASLGRAAARHPLDLHPLAAILLVGAVALGGYVWMVRNREHRFFALVGYPREALVTLLVAPPLLLELATGIAVRL